MNNKDVKDLEDLEELRIRIRELEEKSKEDEIKHQKEIDKINKKHDKEIQKKNQIIKSLQERNTALNKKKALAEAERKILSESIQNLQYKHRSALYMKYGASSEKYHKLFKISKSDAIHLIKLHECKKDVEAFENQHNILPPLKNSEISIEGTQKDKIDDKFDDISKKNFKSKRKYVRNRNPQGRINNNGGGRQKFNPELERKIVSQLDLDMKCPVCGNKLKYIGEIGIGSEYLKLKDKFFIIEKYFQYKFVCKKCNKAYIKDLDKNGVTSKPNGFIVTPPQNRFIRKGIVDDNIVADTVISKFEVGIPNTRQAEQYKAMGLTISARNMTNWQNKLAEALKPFAEQLRIEMLESKALNFDETYFQVLEEEYKSDISKSYIWIMVNPDPEKRAVYYHYNSSRATSVFKNLIGDYDGYIQSDAYIAYTSEKQNYVHKSALCWVHTRRAFATALKSGDYAKGSEGYKIIETIVSYMADIFRIEKENRRKYDNDLAMDATQFINLRKKETLKIIKKLTKYITKYRNNISVDSNINDAMGYYVNHIDALKVYLECELLTPGNQIAELRAKSIINWRNNSLFAGSETGAETGAILSSLIQTAKMNNIEPNSYVKYLMKVVEENRGLELDESDYSIHLPFNLSTDILMDLEIKNHSVMPKKQRILAKTIQ